MLTARAFWMVRRSEGLEAGSEPPDLTAMVMSFAMRANCFAMRFHRANIVCLRTSKMRPMAHYCSGRRRPYFRRQKPRLLRASVDPRVGAGRLRRAVRAARACAGAGG